MPYGQAAVAPFMAGDWLFSHNGLIPGWPESTLKLAERLPVAELLPARRAGGLGAAVGAHRQPTARRDPAGRCGGGRRTGGGGGGAGIAAEHLCSTDGEQLVATTWTHSLKVRRTADSVTVSSEPFGAGDWDDVPDRSLLVATATTLHITPLEGRE